MNFLKLSLMISLILVGQLIVTDAFAQIGPGESPFQRDYSDVKYLDAYFGIGDEKIEVSPGDENVPFTVVMFVEKNSPLLNVRLFVWLSYIVILL